MAGSVLKARYRFNIAAGSPAYVNDRAVPATGIEMIKNMVVPPDMTQAQAETVINAVGAQLLSFGNIDIVPGTRNIPCSSSSNFKPRRLKFIRSNGNSISIVAPLRDQLIQVATNVRNAINAVNAENQVICIQLIGEEYGNILDELAVANRPAPVPGVPSRPPATVAKKIQYSGTMNEYASDVPFGAATLAKFAINTDTISAATGRGDVPTIFEGALAGCLGEVTAGGLCPPPASRSPRYYNVTSLIAGDAANSLAAQNTKVPVAANAPADIVTCGQALVALESTACIGYKGEDYSRLHNLIAAAA